MPPSPALPRIPVRKVPGATSFLHHLLRFVISRPASDASLAGLAPDPRPEGAGETIASRGPAAGIRRKKLFRNGRESREMLPLWKVAGEAIPSRGPAAGIRRKKLFRNGRESREMLPLWKGAGETIASRRPVARIRRKSYSATAENRGKCCRCGKGPERQ